MVARAAVLESGQFLSRRVVRTQRVGGRLSFRPWPKVTAVRALWSITTAQSAQGHPLGLPRHDHLTAAALAALGVASRVVEYLRHARTAMTRER